jgi:polyisoprenoid-binding protein YceI
MNKSNPARWSFAVLAALLGFGTAQAEPVTLVIDPNHTQVGFGVRHFFTKVPGRFSRFTGTIVYDEANLAASQVNAEIETASITTDNERRDTHLRSPDFFAADSFPKITFQGRKVEPAADGSFKVQGDLTIRGVSKPVVLEVKKLGMRRTPDGALAGFEATTRVNRLDYGVKWNRLVEGSNMLGDDVDITISVEAKTPPKPEAKK